MERRFRLEDIKDESIGTNSKIIRQHYAKPKSVNYVDGTFKPLLDAFLDCSTCNCVNHECDRYCDGHQCGPYCETDCGSET